MQIKYYDLCSMFLSYISFLLLNVFKLRIKLNVKIQVILNTTLSILSF